MIKNNTKSPKNSTITIPDGKYLGDILPHDYKLPEFAFLIGGAGIGKTTWFIEYCKKNKIQFVIIEPNQLAAEQIIGKYPELDAYYEHIKTGNRFSTGIVTVENSFPTIAQRLGQDTNRFVVVRDECHNNASSSGYRAHEMQATEDTIFSYKWASVLYMTATPLPLSNPEYKNFVTIKVNHNLRKQDACFVTWDKDKITQQDALVSNCDPKLNQKHFILLDNINQSMEKIGPKLQAIGYKPENIFYLNTKTKHTDIAREIIENRIVPEPIKVVFSTSISNESVSFDDVSFDRIHIISRLHPNSVHQLANRFRKKPVEMVYIYTNSNGRQVGYDYAYSQKVEMDSATIELTHIKHKDDVDPTDTSIQAEIKRKSIQTFAMEHNYIRSKNSQWEFAHSRIDYAVFRKSLEWFCDNPHAYKRELKQFGWHFHASLHITKPGMGGGQMAAAENISQSLKDAREAQYVANVEAIRNMGLPGVEHEIEIALLESDLLSVGKDVVRLTKTIVGNDEYSSIWATYDEQFQTACDLALETKGSRRKLSSAIRMIKIQRLRAKDDKFTEKLYTAFPLGEKFTSAGIHQKIIEVYKKDRLMWVFSRDFFPFRNSKNKTNMITERQAVKLVGELFELNRTKCNGNNCYEFVSDNPISKFFSLSEVLLEPLSEKPTKNTIPAMA